KRFRENPDLYHRLLLSKAILLSNVQRLNESLEIFTRLKSESEDPFILAVAYGTMGAIYNRTGEYDKALENTLKSIDYFKKENDTKNYVFGLTSIANILTVNDRHQEALSYLNEAVTYLDELQNARMSFNVYSTLGVLYKEVEQYDESITYHKKALDIAVTLQDPMYEAITSLNIGNSYIGLEDYERALQFYQRSMQLSRRLDMDYGIYINFINIGSLYTESGDFRLAAVALDSALVYAIKLDYPNEKSTLYKNLSELYMQLRDPVRELEYYKKHVEIKDELFNEEKNRAIEDLRIKYETDLKEQDLELVASELENKTIQFQLTLTLVGLLLSVLFGGGFFFIRQNQNLQALYDRNLEILNNYVPVKEIQNHEKDDAKGSLKGVFQKVTEAMEEQKLFKQADLTLADLVSTVDVNEKYISQAISLYGNKSFYQFLHYYRINEARRLLVEAEDDLQIKEIMFDCGYRSRSTFINAFKEYTGMTPSQFKSRLPQQESS
ncbi:MAG: helix-turn-helix domain-containing protein, partial [Bacteroidetes bacterium]|nr:helix-turn-helix domain-containing protein [Bacteroidota bacterium]